MNEVAKEALKRAIDYPTYLEQIDNLVQANATSGPNQSDSLINYTRLNRQRMRRLNKTLVTDEKLVDLIQSLPVRMLWVVITEAWCGDAAQNLPYIARLAGKATNVDLKLVYRDENNSYMDRYLTNGSRSIPKLIIYDQSNMKELATWGPRPYTVQKMVMDYKRQVDHSMSYDEFSEQIHSWYSKDKNATLNVELLAIFQSLNTLKKA